MSNRRSFLSRLASAGAGLMALPRAARAQEHLVEERPPQNAGQTVALHPRAVFETPDIGKLPYEVVDGVKEFRLTAEVVRTQFVPGRTVDAWGYNGSVPGPTIEVEEGDRVRVIFRNNLPEMTAIHWHGLEIPMEMDGVPGLGQDPVKPGETFNYEFTVHQNGTFFYHSHFAMQEMMGLVGFFIIHPAVDHAPPVDRDFGLILQEWALLPNNTVPNTLSMEFNWLTLNGKSGPATTPMLVKQNERVRIRFVNLGMDHHPMHLHGHQFSVTGTEGGRVPQSAWYPGNTVLVGVAQARDVEFEAKYLGDWMLHCHLPHHMMNQMISMVGPMAHGGAGVPTGLGMEEGMGVVRRGNALSEDLGPSLGRGLGTAADRERPVSAAVGAEMQHMTAHDAASVPGFPQDMWMPMDEAVEDKPELQGLRKGWTGAMMGMMTLVRILPPERFDAIMASKRVPPPAEAYKVSFRTDPSPPVGSESATIHVSVTDPSGVTIRDATVRLTLVMPAMPAMGMAEMRDSTLLQWNGTDYSGTMKILMSGGWNVMVDVERAGQPHATYRLRLEAK
ncbi:MAG TPA: multicopper oxidase domain-containing protein [Terriglobia bacterium]|nr:multicopper oxidase domain-containing protein [Terriglobia bacterium]